MVKPAFSPNGRDARLWSAVSVPSRAARRSSVPRALMAAKPSITSGVTGASLQPQIATRCRPAFISSTPRRKLYKKDAQAPVVAPVVPTLPHT